MKKVIASSVLGGFCLVLMACGRNVEETLPAETTAVETTTAAIEEPVRVNVVVYGSIEAGSDNESFCVGAQRAAEELDVKLQILQSADEKELEDNVLNSCESGCDYVISAAPEGADYIAKYGQDYPNISFAVLDADSPCENATSVYLSWEDAFFQAGATSALFTKQTEYAGINDEAVLGWVGGMNIPLIYNLYQAFEQGARSVDPEILILEQYAGSWEDPEEAYRLAVSQYEQGADIIVSLTGEGDMGIRTAAESNGFFVIGMDGSMAESGNHLLTISKDMERIGYLVARGLLQDGFEGETEVELSMADGCVVLDGISAVPETIEKEVQEERVASDANA